MQYLRLIALFILHAVSFVQAAEKISIKGSDTLGAKMVPQLAEGYKAAGHKVNFEIAAEGSSIAFTTLLDGTAELGMSSRAIKQKERNKLKAAGLTVTEHVVAIDMIAVIVHKDNPISNLTKKQVEQIFTSKMTRWDDLSDGKLTGNIAVFTRNTSSGTYKTFQKLAMNKKPYGSTTQKMAGSFHPNYVSPEYKNGIAYVGLAYLKSKHIKGVNINGVFPSRENSSTYPLSRSLYFYSTQHTSKEALDFVKWIQTSPKAEEIVTKVGFVPVPKNSQP